MINKFSILNGAKHFYSGIFQNYLILILAKKYIKYSSGTTWIKLWKINGMSKENMENITKSCLINNNISIPKKVRNIYIYIYFLHIKSMANRFKYKFALSNCLFGSVELTANTDTALIPIQLWHRISFWFWIFLSRWKRGEKCHSFWSLSKLICAYW